ncbi:hypothetical protein TNCV_1048021 [Trichonephila clavipes]|nr:hypothetical protein TNCV_1048021 [Trichonephila clavipes]
MEVCQDIQRDAYPDHQTSTVVMVDFLDIGEHTAGVWFYSYKPSGISAKESPIITSLFAASRVRFTYKQVLRVPSNLERQD